MSHLSEDELDELEAETADAKNVIGVAPDGPKNRPVVLVEQKESEDDLDDEDIVANRTTRDAGVMEVGEIRAEDGGACPDEDAVLEAQGDRHNRHRPPVPGVSATNENSTACTLGQPIRITNVKAVRDAGARLSPEISDGTILWSLNEHCAGRAGQALFGESVVQPSPLDGGDDDDRIGDFVARIPLEDGCKTDWAGVTTETAVGYEPHQLDAASYGTGVMTDGYADLHGEKVTNTGRSVGVSSAEVKIHGATVRVNYGKLGTIRVKGCILTGDMSEGGQSGSNVYRDSTGELVGRVFAGSPSVTVVDTAAATLDALGGGAEFVMSAPEEPDPEPEPEPKPPGKPDEPGERGRRIARGRTENPGAPEPFSTIDLTTETNQHIAEREYHEAVEVYLRQHLTNVTHEEHFPEANRFADFTGVSLPGEDGFGAAWYAVEVENDFSTIYNGVGQALLYAGLSRTEFGRENVSPLVILPDEGVEQPEVDVLREHVPIVLFPVGESDG